MVPFTRHFHEVIIGRLMKLRSRSIHIAHVFTEQQDSVLMLDCDDDRFKFVDDYILQPVTEHVIFS